MAHEKWSDIGGFHNVRKTLEAYPHLTGSRPTITYRAKVKLHGTNAGVQVRKGDTLIAQSRTRYITPTDDNAGFAAWAEGERERFLRCRDAVGGKDLVIFGEWCGPGIMKGTAVNQLPHKVFAIFGLRFLDVEDSLVVDPGVLAECLEPLLGEPDVAIVPWWGNPRQINPLDENRAALQAQLDSINTLVMTVEACCPFAYAYGIEGVGEGLVFYPVSHPGRENFNNLAFKAKGEKHKIVRRMQAAQIDPEVAASIEDFATLFVTPARCEQGARAVNRGELVFESRFIGPFLAWISKDIKKESTAELEASGLEWKQVSKPIMGKARAWYMEELNRL